MLQPDYDAVIHFSEHLRSFSVYTPDIANSLISNDLHELGKEAGVDLEVTGTCYRFKTTPIYRPINFVNKILSIFRRYGKTRFLVKETDNKKEYDPDNLEEG